MQTKENIIKLEIEKVILNISKINFSLSVIYKKVNQQNNNNSSELFDLLDVIQENTVKANANLELLKFEINDLINP